MAAVTGLTTVKRFTYRGNAQEEFSNKYHFKSGPPGDDPSWLVLANDLINLEKACFPPTVSFVQAYGYNTDNPADHHVFAHDFTASGSPPTGTFTVAGGVAFAGDQAACIEWSMDRLNSRGKRVYLRKYFHAGYSSSTNADDLFPGYMTALENFTFGSTGVAHLHGGLRSQRVDDNTIGGIVLPHTTTRTLKRRGKRPRTGN